MLMLEYLNAYVGDSADANASPKKLLIKYARQPDLAAPFNYASMAHNNEFFFRCLSPYSSDLSQPPKEEAHPPSPYDPEEQRTEISQKSLNPGIPSDLKILLQKDFSSIESLRQDFVNTAVAMFGPGFVWLVARRADASRAYQIRRSDFALLTTYLAGSPYPGAHFRRQSVDMSTQAGTKEALLNSVASNKVGAMGPKSESAEVSRAPGGFFYENALIPILCINTWQHVWIHDYGIAGKRAYAERWWAHIDWTKVRENAAPVIPLINK